MPSTETFEFAQQLGNADLLAQFRTMPAEAWAAAYDGDEALDCFAQLYDAIPIDDLVVGFEIPPVIKRRLAARGSDYLSLHLHPIRFLTDLAFSAYTNVPSFAASLNAITCEPFDIERQASRFSARLTRLDPVQSRLPEGIPVLFGQTSIDSSLIAGGRFMQWQDYADDLAEALDGWDEIVFMRHPLANWRPDTMQFLCGRLGKTIVGTAGNGYAQIMSGRNLGPCFTLSSSMGVEAEAFGYPCRFLLGDPRDKFVAEGLDHVVRAPLDHRLFEFEFWERMLAGTGQGIDARAGSFYLGRNFVRGTIQGSAFAGIEGREPFAPMQKLLIPAAGASVGRIDELAGVLAGAGPYDRLGAVAAAASNDIDLKIAPMPLAAGVQWIWDSSVALPELQLKGFHDVEVAGVWSDGLSCEIELPIHGNGEDLVLYCEAEVSFFSGVTDERPALLIRGNGIPVAGLLYSPNDREYHHITWTASAHAPGRITLRFESSHASTPRQGNGGEDDRNLGFMLRRLSISAQSASRDSGVGGLSLWGLENDPIEISWVKGI